MYPRSKKNWLDAGGEKESPAKLKYDAFEPIKKRLWFDLTD
jgi:hypothetical protein